jgi:WD repeat-containing protein 59
MRGVTMTKRNTTSDADREVTEVATKDSGVLNPGDFQRGNAWGEAESLEEEVLRISDQVPNVKWENIDVEHRALHASLRGPWGTGGETTFVKVSVDIPEGYPEEKPPKFSLEAGSSITTETRKRIDREIQRLTAQFLQRKQNCLAVVFSYLLGEVDLETSTTFFKNVRDLDDDVDDLADESSSDEDDNDIPAGGSASMSQELSASTELEPVNTFATTRRLAIPPLPRFCGARFANDGRLVCFFPTKEEQSKTSFAILPDMNRDKAKSEPSFAGFGRLAQDAPPPRYRHAHEDASATEEQSDDSEGSSGSSSSSSSDSDSEITTLHSTSLWYQPMKRFRKTWSAHDSMRSSGGGTGGGTGTGTGTGTTARRRPGKPRNVISIYDLSSELPSKKHFAREYAIFGDGAEVCEHNARVAIKYGCSDLADIWRYASLLLRSDIPLLELHEQSSRRPSVLVIARDAVARAQLQEHGAADSSLTGRVKWGCHPLAREFIHELFDHFDKLADIQMLAMLSCIFGESLAEDSIAYAESHLPQPETPLPMKAPSFSLEYFPTDPYLWTVRAATSRGSNLSSAVTTPRTAHTPNLYSGSLGSDEAVWTGEPASNSYSTGETPPMKTGRERLMGSEQSQGTLSTSPNSRLYRRANTVAANFAASLPRALAGAVGTTAGPASSIAQPGERTGEKASQQQPGKKKSSPAETILHTLAPSGITWGGSTVFGTTAAAAPITDVTPATARSSISDDDRRRDDGLTTLVPFRVECVIEDRAIFDDDGWMSIPLLEPSHGMDYVRYRYAYSELLHMWGERLSRLEILKFNVLDSEEGWHEKGYGVDTPYDSHANAEMTATINRLDKAEIKDEPFPTRHSHLQHLLASGRGLDVVGLCPIHETQLTPYEVTHPHSYSPYRIGGAVGTCERCPQHRGVQRTLTCVYCRGVVEALFPACLGCGCVMHEGCLAEWHAEKRAEAEQNGIKEWREVEATLECPAGDECVCVRDAGNGRLESWEALLAELRGRPGFHDKLRGAEKEEGLIMRVHDRDGHASSTHDVDGTAVGRLRGIEAAAGGRRPRRQSVPAKLAANFANMSGGGLHDSDNEGSNGPSTDGKGKLPLIRPDASRTSRGSLQLARESIGVDRHDEESMYSGYSGRERPDREDWESIASSQGIPSISDTGGGPRQLGVDASQAVRPLSAAKMSLFRKGIGAVGAVGEHLVPGGLGRADRGSGGRDRPDGGSRERGDGGGYGSGSGSGTGPLGNQRKRSGAMGWRKGGN